MIRNLRICAAGAVLVMAMGTPLLWAAPLGTGFNYQGQLKQAGLPVNGSCDIQFTLWDDPAATQPANQLGGVQTTGGVTIQKGLFSVELNAGGQFGPDAFDGDARWLGMSVRCPAGGGNFTPLVPRQKITAGPYAQHAMNIAIGGGDSVWSLNGANTFYASGNVGIGTSSPSGRLDVRSGHDSYLRLDESFGDLHFNGGADGTFGIFNEGIATGRTSFVTSGAERFSVLNDGRVGVATTNPGARFEAYAQAGEGMVAIKGRTEPSFDLFGNFLQGGIGVWGDAPSNIGVLGTSTENNGVRGDSQTTDGIFGFTHAAGKSGVYGRCAADGFGVTGSTDAGFGGVFGFGPRNGVFGLTSSGSDSGVHGRNDGSGWGVNGYAAGALVGEGRFGGTGVEGLSDGLGGYGVIGRAHGLNGVGVHAEAQNGNATALWAYNPGGRSALLEGYVDVYGAMNISGSASVRILTITGGADLAEPFDVSPFDSGVNAASESPQAKQADETPCRDSMSVQPGMVVVIDPDQPGKLRVSSEPYDRRVAGIISGANSLSPGMVMRATDHPGADGEHPVALTGRVWCHCDATEIGIVPGDMLTTSEIPGFAMKAMDMPRAQGAIIGKAMSSLRQGQSGLVLVLVNLQ